MLKALVKRGRSRCGSPTTATGVIALESRQIAALQALDSFSFLRDFPGDMCEAPPLSIREPRNRLLRAG
jgi:hypothetical protein